MCCVKSPCYKSSFITNSGAGWFRLRVLNVLSLLTASAVSFPHDVRLSVRGYHQGEGGSAPETWRAAAGVQRARPLPALGSIASACGCARASLRASHRGIPLSIPPQHPPEHPTAASLRASHRSIPAALGSGSRRWAREEGNDRQLWALPQGPVLGDAALSKRRIPPGAQGGC